MVVPVTRGDPLDVPLLRLSPHDEISLRQATSGILCLGETGCGKSTTLGENLRTSLLRAGCGFLVLPSKIEETRDWIIAATREGRGADIRIFGPDHPHRLNALDYLYKAPGTRGGAMTENVLAALHALHEARSGGRSQNSEQFFQDAAQCLAGSAIDLLGLAGETISFAGIQEVLLSAPTSNDEVRSEEWQRQSRLNQLVDAATTRNDLTDAEQTNLAACVEYWLHEFPTTDARTRSGILSTLQSTSFYFRRGLLAQLFAPGGKQLLPEDSFAGRILIIDTPVKEFLEIGQLAQVLYKQLWMKAVERRDRNKYPKPVVLWVDEAQNTVTQYDTLFQATARSTGCVTVYLTQNLDSLKARRPGPGGEAEIESLLGNLALKVFMSNSHAGTNSWAASLCGRTWQTRSNVTAGLGGEGNMSASTVESERNLVDPVAFLKLKRRGVDGIAEAIVHRAGEPFQASGMNHLKVSFRALDDHQ